MVTLSLPEPYERWRAFKAEFPILAICGEHGAAATFMVLLLELIKFLLALLGAPTAWHYLDVADVFLTGDVCIVVFLVVHTCYRIWHTR